MFKKQHTMFNNSTTRPAPSFITLLAILFIALKLVGIISWSWWWVLSPIWISFAILISVLVVIVVIAKWGD
jgi:predicted small integral membrane protein